MATFTASVFRSVIAKPHIGTVWTGGNATAAVTGTASSVFLLCEVPSGAVVVDWWLRATSDIGAVNQTVQIGTSASPSGIAAAFSLCHSLSVTHLLFANFRAPGPFIQAAGYVCPLPTKISLSDDVQPAKVWIQAEVGVAISASASFVFMLAYTMDGLGARTTIR